MLLKVRIFVLQNNTIKKETTYRMIKYMQIIYVIRVMGTGE